MPSMSHTGFLNHLNTSDLLRQSSLPKDGVLEETGGCDCASVGRPRQSVGSRDISRWQSVAAANEASPGDRSSTATSADADFEC